MKVSDVTVAKCGYFFTFFDVRCKVLPLSMLKHVIQSHCPPTGRFLNQNSVDSRSGSALKKYIFEFVKIIIHNTQ